MLGRSADDHGERGAAETHGWEPYRVGSHPGGAHARRHGGYITDPRQTKLILTQDVSDVVRFMEGAEMLGTGLQVRRIARPKKGEPHVFQEWWEVRVFDDPHLGERPTETGDQSE
ncbi:hypothetical protein GCM10023084_05780 [Streptomyces lacrimifluminis]|uniref:Uncharacterized protein n=1 Tax=Streptomyces lacrimifluminis TaxID=1500077 RepID=A0A917KRI2_9ACTN|nr:hypothetical protein [Streptomyces lacrimifluminis]GGJ23098.1 hypothetical protein GCM10012282_19520 [Streptomyces lacrimifluminis]